MQGRIVSAYVHCYWVSPYSCLRTSFGFGTTHDDQPSISEFGQGIKAALSFGPKEGSKIPGPNLVSSNFRAHLPGFQTGSQAGLKKTPRTESRNSRQESLRRELPSSWQAGTCMASVSVYCTWWKVTPGEVSGVLPKLWISLFKNPKHGFSAHPCIDWGLELFEVCNSAAHLKDNSVLQPHNLTKMEDRRRSMPTSQGGNLLDVNLLQNTQKGRTSKARIPAPRS